MSEGLRNAYALLIGIGDDRHADEVPSLPYAVRDAEALRDLLIDPRVCAFPADHVALLTDAQANREQIVRHLSKWLPNQSQEAELVLIYFAGHGMIRKVGEVQHGYLLSHDAHPDDIITHGVSMADVNQWIDNIQAAAVVVCLDCCHAGKVIHAGATVRDVPRDLEIQPHALPRLEGRERYLIASCGHGQKSFECDDLGHGLFTYHLLKGIAGAADRTAEGKVGIAALFAYIGKAVKQEAQRRFQRPQTPWIHSTYGDEAYISRIAADYSNPYQDTDNEATESPGQQFARHLAADRRDEIFNDLKRLRTQPDVQFVPLLCRCLSHADPTIRTLAGQALHALGWSKVAAEVESLARQDDPGLGAVLDGLAAFEAHHDVVKLLDRLVDLLRGDARNRAILLLERKRLSLELEQMTRLFEQIQSPYQLKRVLGQGLITAVYLARMENTPLDVVVRVLRPELARMPDVRSQFLDLCRQSLPCVHHNLVMTRDVRACSASNIYFAVCDHVDGVTLQKVIEAHKQFQPLQIVHLIRQLIGGLTPLHQRGIPHGGVKPSNIFLCGQDRVLLGDASLPPQAMGLALNRLSYDYRYVAPEAIKRNGKPASDLYALGCVVYELLCGRPPFVADDHHELATKHLRDTVEPPSVVTPGLNPAWDHFLGKLLARDEKARYPDLNRTLLGVVKLEQALVDASREWSDGLHHTIHTLNIPPGGVGALPPDAQPPPVQPADPDTLAPLLASASLDNYRSMVSLVPFNPAGTMASSLPAASPTVKPAEPSSVASPAGPPLPVIPGYEILAVLGTGGMGVVYKARQIALDRLVALKVLQPLTPDANAAARFKTEALAVAQLDHPNIVGIYDTGEHEGKLYLTLQFCEGGTLADRLQTGPMSQTEAAALIAELAQGVHYAHDHGVLHRDLKPSNILLTSDGRPKVADFGLARIVRGVRSERVTAAGAVLGTPGYMAPEQVTGEASQLSPATDVYGLGAILYTLLTGQPPFGGESSMEAFGQILHKPPPPIRDKLPNVDHELERICMRCLAKTPTDRYVSAEQLSIELGNWSEGVGDAVVDEHRPRWLLMAFRLGIFALIVLAIIGLLFLALGLTPAEQ